LHWLIDASSNTLSLLKFYVAPANCESFLRLIFDRIGRGRRSVCATGHCFDAIFRSELTEGAHAKRYSHPRSPNAKRSTPGGGIPSTRAIAAAKLQSDLLVAIRYPQRRTCNRIWLRESQWSRNTQPW
jgi:hypothetical protein